MCALFSVPFPFFLLGPAKHLNLNIFFREKRTKRRLKEDKKAVERGQKGG
jgi:hypothetical protein